MFHVKWQPHIKHCLQALLTFICTTLFAEDMGTELPVGYIALNLWKACEEAFDAQRHAPA